jgi:hypothetical protein
MHLKEAIAKNKLRQFASEHGKHYPRASKKHFEALIKVAALGTEKPKQGTSRKGSRAG